MPRSVNSVAAKARRKKILKLAKGYFGRRKNVHAVAKNAVHKGLQYAYRDRRQKKRKFRALWIMRINAGARLHGMSYAFLYNICCPAIHSYTRGIPNDFTLKHSKNP